MGSASFKDAESWTPLCLPKFNNSGTIRSVLEQRYSTRFSDDLCLVSTPGSFIHPCTSAGFLYAHVSYIDAQSKACLVMLSTSKDAFFDLSECRKRVIQVLQCDSAYFLLSSGAYVVTCVLLDHLPCRGLGVRGCSWVQQLASNGCLAAIMDAIAAKRYTTGGPLRCLCVVSAKSLSPGASAVHVAIFAASGLILTPAVRSWLQSR